MVEVKIPKIFNITKAYIIKHLEDYVRAVAYDFITGSVCNLDIIYSSRKFFVEKMGINGNTVYVKRDEYEREMCGGKKRFKDSCYFKKDCVVIYDEVYKLCEKAIALFGEPDILDPKMSVEDKIIKIHSRMMDMLEAWESGEEDEKDKVTVKNDQKRPTP